MKNEKELPISKEKTDWDYFNMIDPRSGLRYDIPLLSPTNPLYFTKYVHMMKLKEESPELFEKIIRWE